MTDVRQPAFIVCPRVVNVYFNLLQTIFVVSRIGFNVELFVFVLCFNSQVKNFGLLKNVFLNTLTGKSIRNLRMISNKLFYMKYEIKHM